MILGDILRACACERRRARASCARVCAHACACVCVRVCARVGEGRTRQRTGREDKAKDRKGGEGRMKTKKKAYKGDEK